MTGPASQVPAAIEDYALSILLHDIGKLWERSSEAPKPTPAELGQFCVHLPEAGTYSHIHAALSARLIQEVVGEPGLQVWGPRNHVPDVSSREGICAQLADRLAHGETEPDESRDSPGSATTPLRWILSSLAPAAEPRFLTLEKADDLRGRLLPTAVAPLSREDYRYHWMSFREEAEKVGGAGKRLEAWRDLLEAFASRAPAGSTGRQLKMIPDVDLFSHSLAAAALACAIYKGPLSQTGLLALRADFYAPASEKIEAPLVRLIAVGLAGGRSILEERESSRSAGFLRGASLYLDLLAGQVARRLAGRLGLPSTSILPGTAGGHFILAPAGAAWEGIRDEIEGVLSLAGRGDLGIEAASVDLAIKDFRSGLARKLLELERDVETALRRRVPQLARKDYDRVFGTIDSRREDRWLGLLRRIESLGILAAPQRAEEARRLDLEGLADLRMESAEAPEASGAERCDAVLAARIDGVRRLLLSIPAGGASLSRILGILAAARRFLRGRPEEEIPKSPGGSLRCISAGADGLLAAGDLRSAAEFARSFREDFAAFAGGSGLSISLGIAAGDGLEAAGDLAGRAAASLAAAAPSPEDLSMTFLEEKLGFDAFLALRDVAEDALFLAKPGSGAPPDLPGKLRAAVQEHRLEAEAIRETEPGRGPDEVREAAGWKRWRWIISTALQAPDGARPEVQERLSRLQAWLLDAEGRNIERLPLIVRWVELLRKGEGS